MTNLGIQDQGRLYKTSNGGASWSQQSGTFSDQGNALNAVHFFDEDYGFAFGSTGTTDPSVDSLRIWITENGGEQWNRLPTTQLPAPIAAEGIWLSYGNGLYEVVGDTIWLGTRRGRVWRSADRGQSWEAFYLDESIAMGDQVLSLAFKDANNGIAVTSTAGAFRTEDGGASWEPINVPPSIGNYQIEYVPGTEGTYFLSYEGHPFSFYWDLQLAYTLNHGDTWIPVENPGLECFEFLSPSIAWGGGYVNSPTEGGMFQWTGTLSPDYYATVSLDRLSSYTIATPRHLDSTNWNLEVINGGIESLNDFSSRLEISKDGTPYDTSEDTHTLTSGAAVAIPYTLFPTETGLYQISAELSHEALDDTLYQTTGFFELSDSILAKDDGTDEGELGWGFGDPDWYGYYGSSFDLMAADTVTAITIFISPFSDFTGSIHLTIHDFDASGRPNQEVYHSEEIILADHGISPSNIQLTYSLENAVPLEAGRYLFAAGQDSLQGIIGFAFDYDHISADGFWLVSSLVRPEWGHVQNRETLMIRPHFNAAQKLTTAVKKVPTITNKLKISPNPFSRKTVLEFELKDKRQPLDIEILDISGRQLQSLTFQHPPSGITKLPLEIDGPAGVLLLRLRQGINVETVRLVHH